MTLKAAASAAAFGFYCLERDGCGAVQVPCDSPALRLATRRSFAVPIGLPMCLSRHWKPPKTVKIVVGMQHPKTTFPETAPTPKKAADA
ncbi:hypothetical protein [Bradyrhizobium sp.]|uniref:hypothetical protein n=1 Tax=Bradyrhizobium sp. TaxID=376 RepID=UPI00272738F6|nr:hypothetical protein [Bradyrhizobium sp.]MDO9296905.1 hypothetical protein [Bradyrhizobium sp.]